MSLFLRAILALIHFLYSAYIFINTQWTYLQRELANFIHPRTLNCLENILDECDINKIKKLPRHLVIVVGIEDVSFSDLARIIVWSIALGIPCISFYDKNGIIKQNSSILKKEFEKLKLNFPSRIIWMTKSDQKITNDTNGFKCTRVNFLSYEDGKPQIINLTKEICQQVKSGLLKTDDINQDFIDEKLKIDHFPDPDIAIVTGSKFSTFGLLPWHIRLTEFFHIPTHHNVLPKDFLNVLQLFSRCQQRFGR
ncbi:dehydrodolichyl diphosphate synthase complex subunit Nus1 [Chelonus insularis]|uniref:dehydrodolichyl diphosphate synthase complex subunit Nus1 n=1 Tax=Chelonus insularis TaxID=460826 RepID=UPI00158D2923|nr:dehydrodolichyl diphosphate synthase complex subunit Nus1 [Chelonus insularis]